MKTADYPVGFVDDETLALINQPTCKITRSRMGLLQDDDLQVASAEESYLDRAYDFLYEMTAKDKLNTTDLFSEEGEKQIVKMMQDLNEDFN